jgi:pimeloyl-ACP methyl ester carboxylesterase
MIVRALLFWLSAFELLAASRRLWGLTWLGPTGRRWPLVPILLALLRSLTSWRQALVLVLLAPFGALLHLIAATLRNYQLNPQTLLYTGSHPHHSVEAVQIPLTNDYIPGLYLVPQQPTPAAVVVLHGSGCDKTYFSWQLSAALLKHGIAVLLIDLDGHGDNPRPQSYPAMLDNGFAPVAWLRTRHTHVGMLGISLGGAIAARAAANGNAVQALALLETPIRLQFTAQDRYREAAALLEPFVFELFRESGPFFVGSTVYDLIRVQQRGRARIRATIGTFDLIDQLDLQNALPHIQVPLLTIYGGRDAIVTPTQAAAVQALLPDHAQFQLVPRASHLTLILHQPTLDALAEWFASTLQAANQQQAATNNAASTNITRGG